VKADHTRSCEAIATSSLASEPEAINASTRAIFLHRLEHPKCLLAGEHIKEHDAE